jgi:regulator of sigma E protease
MAIIIFIVILFSLVLIHELGHFVVAKLFGIRVDEFGIGYPPREATLFKRGETTFTLNWLPFGGFVKIFGEDAEETPDPSMDRSRHFASKPKYAQALVLVAGVVMNFLCGWLLLSVGYMTGLPTAVGTEPAGSHVIAPVLTITSVDTAKPASKAGIQPGDIVEQVTYQKEIVTAPDVDALRNFVSTHGNDELTMNVKRLDKEVVIKVTPSADAVVGQKAGIGVGLDMIGRLELPWYRAPVAGLQSAWYMMQNIVSTFGRLIGDAFHGHSDISQLTGPVGIVGIVGDAYKIGFVYLLSLAALISLNLAVINLIPFPALDGGRLLFVIIESIIRRPIPAKVSNILNTVGFFILIALMLAITYHDIVKLFVH